MNKPTTSFTRVLERHFGFTYYTVQLQKTICVFVGACMRACACVYDKRHTRNRDNRRWSVNNNVSLVVSLQTSTIVKVARA